MRDRSGGIQYDIAVDDAGAHCEHQSVERPFGLTVGLPGDASGQLSVLRATLQALVTISEPGSVVDLEFEWNHDAELNTHPPQLPPIATYLRRHPWAFARFFNRTPPEPTASGTQ